MGEAAGGGRGALGTKEEKQLNKSVGLIITRLHLFFFKKKEKKPVSLEPVLPSKHPAVKVETLPTLPESSLACVDTSGRTTCWFWGGGDRQGGGGGGSAPCGSLKEAARC